MLNQPQIVAMMQSRNPIQNNMPMQWGRRARCEMLITPFVRQGNYPTTWRGRPVQTHVVDGLHFASSCFAATWLSDSTFCVCVTVAGQRQSGKHSPTTHHRRMYCVTVRVEKANKKCSPTRFIFANRKWRGRKEANKE